MSYVEPVVCRSGGRRRILTPGYFLRLLISATMTAAVAVIIAAMMGSDIGQTSALRCRPVIQGADAPQPSRRASEAARPAHTFNNLSPLDPPKCGILIRPTFLSLTLYARASVGQLPAEETWPSGESIRRLTGASYRLAKGSRDLAEAAVSPTFAS